MTRPLPRLPTRSPARTMPTQRGRGRRPAPGRPMRAPCGRILRAPPPAASGRGRGAARMRILPTRGAIFRRPIQPLRRGRAARADMGSCPASGPVLDPARAEVATTARGGAPASAGADRGCTCVEPPALGKVKVSVPDVARLRMAGIVTPKAGARRLGRGALRRTGAPFAVRMRRGPSTRGRRIATCAGVRITSMTGHRYP